MPGHINNQCLIYKGNDGYVGFLPIDPSDKYKQSMLEIMMEHGKIDIIQLGKLEDVIQRYF